MLIYTPISIGHCVCVLNLNHATLNNIDGYPCDPDTNRMNEKSIRFSGCKVMKKIINIGRGYKILRPVHKQSKAK